MRVGGLDIGSRTIAFVDWDGEAVVSAEVTETGIDPVNNARKLIGTRPRDGIVATGYGRDLAVKMGLAGDAITEIKAFSLGAHHLYPDVQTLLDVGGQDSKVIHVSPGGRVARFEMNDRCAAGTGRFLENMAQILRLSVDEFGRHALAADGAGVRLSNVCAVFAESEVVSLIGRGEDSGRVALGVHEAIVERLGSMILRVGMRPRFVFAGGGARNLCLRRLLADRFGVEISVPGDPQVVGALGAALHAATMTVEA